MGISWATRRAFYEQSAAQIDNGLPLTTIINNFSGRMLRQRRAKTASIFDEFGRQVRDGGTLTDAMRVHLTDVEVGLLSAGERTGQIGHVMRFIIDTKDRERRIIGKIRSSMISPAVYMAAGFGTLYMIGSSIVPQFEQIVPPDKWYGAAGLMRSMGQFATGWGMPIFLVLFAMFLTAIWFSFPRWIGPVRDRLDLSVFPYTVYKEMQGITWLVAFLSLIRSGVVDVSAIDGQIRTASPWLAARLTPVRSGLRNGRNLFDALNGVGIGFPSPDLVEEIGAYVAFPDFSEKLSAIVSVYTERFEKRMATIGVVVSTVFTLAMYGMFFVIQFGANNLSGMVAAASAH